MTEASNTASHPRVNPYLLETPIDAAEAIREHSRKMTALHEGRSEAWRAMREAIAQHEFMSKACTQADRDDALLNHRLHELIKREAFAAVWDID